MRPHEEIVAEASDHTITASRLRELYEANKGKERVVRAIAGNPNTPPEILIKIVPYHIEAFCQNPAAPLLLVENPSFLREMDNTGWRSLLRCENLPKVYLQMFLDMPETAKEASFHVANVGEVAPEVAEEVAWDTLGRVVVNVSENTKHIGLMRVLTAYDLFPARLVPYLADLTKVDPQPYSEDTPPSKLRGNQEWQRLRLPLPLVDENAPEEVPTDKSVLWNLLFDSTLPSDFLARVADYVLSQRDVKDWHDLAERIARHPQTSEETLHRLYKETKEVLKNPNCPSDLLAWEANSHDKKRDEMAVALHPNTSYEVLLSIARKNTPEHNPQRDKPASEIAKAALILHPDTSQLERRQFVMEDMLEYASSPSALGIRLVLLCQTKEAKILRQASQSLIWPERLAVALNPAITTIEKNWQALLLHDGNRYVRAAARNVNLSQMP
jgi:hypothetical protein